MRVSILLAVPSHPPLQEAAQALRDNRSPTNALGDAKISKRIVLDTSFGAIPLGSVRSGFRNVKELEIGESEDFIVRGEMEVDRIEDIPTQVDNAVVFSDPLIAPFPYCSNAAQGSFTDVQNRLRITDLHNKGLDGSKIAVAIVDTGINLNHLSNQLGFTPRFDIANSWKPTGVSGVPGQHPVDHGTMCAYDALLVAPKATLLDYPVLKANSPGGNVTGSTISTALQAFSHILANYAVAFAPGGSHTYSGLVISNSWGIYHPSWDFPAGHPGRYCDNPSHPFVTIVRALAAAGADILFAAGNCGADCPDGRCQGRTTGAIMGANAYEEVMTVAACLVTNDERLGYSSQGPSIAGMPCQNKPDLTAYSHFLGSEAYGTGSPDSGTSTACPVAAGCVAAIRTKVPAATLPPASLLSQFVGTANQPSGRTPGWNADFGHGIIDPVKTANTLGL